MLTTSFRRARALVLVAAFAALAAACSSSASTRTDAAGADPTTSVPPATAPATIPAGTVLRVGDQLDYLKTILRLGGEDQDFPYTVEYSAFVGGPPMLQAFQGGAIDTGFVASTPLIFAQAGDQDIVAVAGWATENGSYGLVTADPAINGWKDLAGKRVAYQQGTAGEAALLQALDEVGLKLGDVTTVNLPQTQVAAALQSGSADAGLSIEPLTSLYFDAVPDGRQVADAEEITNRSSFVIASQPTLDDPAKAAALGDFLTRLVRAWKHVDENRGEIAQAVYVDTYKLSPERAAEIVAQNGSTSFVSLPGDIVPAQQRLADLFLEAGEIPKAIDVTAQFDTRYNDLVQAAANG